MSTVKKQCTKCGVSITFIVLLMISAMMGIFVKDESQSDTENRSLQKFPEWNIASIENGEYQKSIEAYLSDQFPLRFQWVRMHSNLEYDLGKKEMNGIYIGKDDELFQKSVIPDTDMLNQKRSTINSFVKKYENLNYSMLLVPNKATIYQDKLPVNIESQDQMKIIKEFATGLESSIKFVDGYESLKKNKKERLYYRSDHHWTQAGAYTVFMEWKTSVLPDESTYRYDRYAVNTSFFGTLANASGYYRGKGDTIEISISKSDPLYYVRFLQTKTISTSLFDKAKNEGNHPYDVFLSGNHPSIEIDTTVENQKHLLLIKDSYANSFVSYLLPYYHTITVIDPRYYFEDFYQLLQDHEITDVLFLYNANTFFSDNSLQNMLVEE
ncbi:DHHW family protein [[Eubacterium] hominis]|uniref:DHHW family protein n=1 Tax=[Eubacterium] hominis TaxID=2764325 RepID=UPI003A4D53CF